MSRYLIVTNNPTFTVENPACTVEVYEEATYRDILVKVRDLVYLGHHLHTHPLYGSLRPHETPFRTVILTAEEGAPDMEDMMIVSDAITVCDRFTPVDRATMPDKIRDDYALIDRSLMAHTLSTLC